MPAFASACKMNVQQASFYMKKYGWWYFMMKHWRALHTDNTFWTVRDFF
ncbi:MAG: hypothetical protein LBV41_05580 [Cytophagaceae bacterium]|nr:hypothetical protein [Cytophagaceae bacterium]